MTNKDLDAPIRRAERLGYRMQPNAAALDLSDASSLQVVQRRFTAEERERLRQLAQVTEDGHPVEGHIDRLGEETTRNVDDLTALAAMEVNENVPTLEQMVAVDRLAIAEIQQLNELDHVETWDDLARLGRWAGIQLDEANPTIDQLIEISPYEIRHLNLMASLPLTTWESLTVRSQDTSPNEMDQLLDAYPDQDVIIDRYERFNGNFPTIPQLVEVSRFTDQELNNLRDLDLVESWRHLAMLGGTAMSVQDIAIRTEREVDGVVPTVEHIVAVSRFTDQDLETLEALEQVTNWHDLARLGHLSRNAEDLAAVAALEVRAEGQLEGLAAMDIGENAPTLEQILAVDGFSNDELVNLSERGTIDDWDSLIEDLPPALLRLIIETLDQAQLRQDLEDLELVFGFAPSMTNYLAIIVDLNILQQQFLTYPYHDKVRIIKDYFRDAATFNACFDGASRLTETLGSEGNEVTYQSEGEPREEYGIAQQIQRGISLRRHLLDASNSGIPTLFRIHLGGHGFTIIVKGDTAYQLETLAGSSLSGTLLKSIENAAHYTIDEVRGYFADMVSAFADLRRVGAASLGWNAVPIGVMSDRDSITDPMTVYWTASNLRPPEEIRHRLAEKIQNNRRELREILAVDAFL